MYVLKAAFCFNLYGKYQDQTSINSVIIKKLLNAGAALIRYERPDTC